MEIFTLSSNPFKFGGTHDIIKTTVEEYERVNLGAGFYGILVKNTVKDLYHLAEERSGALVGAGPSKEDLIGRVKSDILNGDRTFMLKQVEDNMGMLAQAESLPNDEFFRRFKGK
jgi:hypothetical protein